MPRAKRLLFKGCTIKNWLSEKIPYFLLWVVVNQMILLDRFLEIIQFIRGILQLLLLLQDQLFNLRSFSLNWKFVTV